MWEDERGLQLRRAGHNLAEPDGDALSAAVARAWAISFSDLDTFKMQSDCSLLFLRNSARIGLMA